MRCSIQWLLIAILCLVASTSALAQSGVSTGRIGSQVTVSNLRMTRNDGVLLPQRLQDSVMLKKVGKKASMYVVQSDILPVDGVQSISADLETNLPVELTPQQCSTLLRQSSSLTYAFTRITIKKYDGNHRLTGTEVIYGGLPGRKSLEETSSEVHLVQYNVTDRGVKFLRFVGEFYLGPTSYKGSEPTIITKGDGGTGITISSWAQIFVLDLPERIPCINRTQPVNTPVDSARMK